MKDKILKYDQFLQNNKQELNSKEYAQSLGLHPTIQSQQPQHQPQLNPQTQQPSARVVPDDISSIVREESQIHNDSNDPLAGGAPRLNNVQLAPLDYDKLKHFL